MPLTSPSSMVRGSDTRTHDRNSESNRGETFEPLSVLERFDLD